MEIKVEVGQVWEDFSGDKFVIKSISPYFIKYEDEPEDIEIYDMNDYKDQDHPNIYDTLQSYCYDLITDKYVGDWIRAIASPEFKGE